MQIVATGFSGLRFLRQSHGHMTEDFIDVYGGYAIRLLRLQADLIRAFDRNTGAPASLCRCGKPGGAAPRRARGGLAARRPSVTGPAAGCTAVAEAPADLKASAMETTGAKAIKGDRTTDNCASRSFPLSGYRSFR
jgi:hypothetical protein